MKKTLSLTGVLLTTALLAVSCGKKDTTADETSEAEETAQQLGDTVASIDEGGGSNSGAIAMSSLPESGLERLFARVAPGELRQPWLDSILLPSAFATGTACSTVTFGSCTSGVRVRDFGGCFVGLKSITGTVSLTWSNGASCGALGVGDSITRVPNFTVTGQYGGTFKVSKTGTVGQKIEKTVGAFKFTNDGINRKFTTAAGATLFDFTTTVLNLTFSGASRLNRTVDSGSVTVTNNLKGTSCTFSPSGVKWAATCNCPKEGSWSGSCDGGTTTTITFTGCGTATVQRGADAATSVAFDRCYGI